MKKLLAFVVLALVIIMPVSYAADFNGDGTVDIAVFRASSGLWSVTGITRIYFGKYGDTPVPGDYDGSGTDRCAIFRASIGLWAVRGETRVYFGSMNDEPKPGDYNGDGIYDFGIFRASTGLWAIKEVTRKYYGSSWDVAIAEGETKTYAGSLPVTGQTTSYRSGDDGYHQKGADFNFQTVSIGGDLVTIDHNTGLMWASDGNEAGCGFNQWGIWYDAIDYCNNLNFAGYTDWRLPNIKELQSLVNYSHGQFGGAFDYAYFPNSNPHYWSSTTLHTVTSYAWYKYFGEVALIEKTSTALIVFRAVRGGE